MDSKIKFFIIALLTFPTFSLASGNFAGIYKCAGMDPYLNRKYTGTVTVTPQNTVYKLEMHYDTGEKYIATGGQWNPLLMSVVFQDVDNLKQVGLEQYKFSADRKTMSGYWVYLGKDKLGTEECTRDT